MELRRKRKNKLYEIRAYDHDLVIGYSDSKRVACEYANQYSRAHTRTYIRPVEKVQASVLTDYLLTEWYETYIPQGFWESYCIYSDIDMLESKLSYNKFRFDVYTKWKQKKKYLDKILKLEDEIDELRTVPPEISTLQMLRTMYDSYKLRLYYE